MGFGFVSTQLLVIAEVGITSMTNMNAKTRAIIEDRYAKTAMLSGMAQKPWRTGGRCATRCWWKTARRSREYRKPS